MDKFLRLIINLRIPHDVADAGSDRLHGDSSIQQVMELKVPRIDLPVLPGRNLAVIVEAAVRDFMLKMKGIDAASDFIERHNRLMERRG
jgi:HPr kinase/phosphorylase